VQREREASLKRLGMNAIDLYQIYWPASKDAPEAASPGSVEEALGAMVRLKDEGTIRHIGVSNFNVRQMRRARGLLPLLRFSLHTHWIATEVKGDPHVRA
jgi:diketogulonate reductase-like aldo/keto reductase